MSCFRKSSCCVLFSFSIHSNFTSIGCLVRWLFRWLSCCLFIHLSEDVLLSVVLIKEAINIERRVAAFVRDVEIDELWRDIIISRVHRFDKFTPSDIDEVCGSSYLRKE